MPVRRSVSLGRSVLAGSTPGTLPADRLYQTFWQYTSTGPIVGDHDLFNGSYDRLQVLANG